MSKAKKDELKLAVQELVNENENLIQSIVSKSENGKLKFNQDESGAFVEAVLDSIIELTDEYGELELRNFGTFKAVRREQRKGRNPLTQEEILIPAKRVTKFKPGKKFSEIVAN